MILFGAWKINVKKQTCLPQPPEKWIADTVLDSTTSISATSVKQHPNVNINPLTAGVAYIRVFIFYWHIKYHLLNMVKIKYDINQQYLKTVDLHFVKSEIFSLTWSCGSRQRDTISSGWKFRLNNLAVKGLSIILSHLNPLQRGGRL